MASGARRPKGSRARKPSKPEFARTLANRHREIEPELIAAYRLEAPDETDRDPIKLLEVNRETIATGIMPLGFPPSPSRGVPYATVIVEITPEEFEQVQAGRLKLPRGWRIAEEIPLNVASR